MWRGLFKDVGWEMKACMKKLRLRGEAKTVKDGERVVGKRMDWNWQEARSGTFKGEKGESQENYVSGLTRLLWFECRYFHLSRKACGETEASSPFSGVHRQMCCLHRPDITNLTGEVTSSKHITVSIGTNPINEFQKALIPWSFRERVYSWSINLSSTTTLTHTPVSSQGLKTCF